MTISPCRIAWAEIRIGCRLRIRDERLQLFLTLQVFLVHPAHLTFLGWFLALGLRRLFGVALFSFPGNCAASGASLVAGSFFGQARPQLFHVDSCGV